MRRVALFVVIPMALAACGGDAVVRSQVRIRTGSGEVVLDVEIARTIEERRRGLMGRESLPPDRGMVFLYDRPTNDPFWMKGTPIPLSIAFWDRKGRIVDILDMDPCLAEPCPRYAPERSYVGAVEATRGYFERHGVGVGDLVQLDIAP